MATRSGKVYEAPNEAMQEDELPDASDASCSSSVVFSKLATRAVTSHWLIGHASSSITGAKLSTGRQVMKYFLHLRHDEENVRNSTSNEEIAYNVVNTVTVF